MGADNFTCRRFFPDRHISKLTLNWGEGKWLKSGLNFHFTPLNLLLEILFQQN
jgi:hypothetical protein